MLASDCRGMLLHPRHVDVENLTWNFLPPNIHRQMPSNGHLHSRHSVHRFQYCLVLLYGFPVWCSSFCVIVLQSTAGGQMYLERGDSWLVIHTRSDCDVD